LASTKEQLVATKCEVIPGDALKLQSPLPETTTFSKNTLAAALICTPHTLQLKMLLFRNDDIEFSWQLIPTPHP
jgi:hypothetical protein